MEREKCELQISLNRIYIPNLTPTHVTCTVTLSGYPLLIPRIFVKNHFHALYGGTKSTDVKLENSIFRMVACIAEKASCHLSLNVKNKSNIVISY